MRLSKWRDYELIDASNGKRLERFGEVVLVRPDPQVAWNLQVSDARWESAHAIYHRSKSGGGFWDKKRSIHDNWTVSHGALRFKLQLMGFKHTGVFPEQATNWEFIEQKLQKIKSPQVLNLFAYTGGATLAAAAAGASVCHVDASKGVVALARENARISGLSACPVRWIVDDCVKFVHRELRRGSTYDAIIMDPPSYGRGPGGEVWKMEDEIFEFLQMCSRLLAPRASFLMVNSYTAGLSPTTIGCMFEMILRQQHGGSVLCDEIGLEVTQRNLALPCGATTIWQWES